MKTKKLKLQSVTLILLMSVLLQACSSHKVKLSQSQSVAQAEVIATTESSQGDSTYLLSGYNNFTPLNQFSLMPRYQNFQNKQFPKQSFIIANMISVVQPEMNERKRDEIASLIARISKKYNIKPEIFVSIIDTESNFQSDLVSSTGDLSMAQINVDVWNKEFLRLNLPGIDKERVCGDLEYSLNFMAQILTVLKQRFSSNDPIWFARYHSSTPKHKKDYFQKLAFRMNLIERSENLRNQIAQIQNIEFLSPVRSSNDSLALLETNNVLQVFLTPEPMPTPDRLYTPKQSVEGKSLEFAKAFIFDVIRL